MGPKAEFGSWPWLNAALAVALYLSLAPCALRGQEYNSCQPPPEVRSALANFPIWQTPTETDWQFHQRQLSTLDSLLKQYPQDFFVRKKYVGLWGFPEEKTKLISEYKALHEQHPDDPEISYLYGVALIGRDTKQAIKLFDSALGKAPAFPWPHLELGNIYVSPVFLDKQRSKENFKTFLAACPAALEGYSQVGSVDDPAFARDAAARLRGVLTPRTDPEALGAYPTLWALEFKAHPPAEYGPLRKQVAEDIARIRALSLTKTWQWYEALRQGYMLVGDNKQSEWANDKRERRLPDLYGLPAMERWGKANPSPQQDDPPDKKQAYYTELLRQSAEWVRERPNTSYIWAERLHAMEHLDNIPAAELEAAVDKYIQVARANAGPPGPGFGDYSTAARILARKHLEPERTVEYAQKALKKMDQESKFLVDDTYTRDEVARVNFNVASSRTQALEFEVQGYLELKQPSKARQTLQQFDDRLQGLKALAGDKEDRRKECLGRESAYWGLMARLAEFEGHKQDAMAYYESALVDRLNAQQKPETGVPDELADNAHKLWTNLGGTEDGWNAWYGVREKALASLNTLTWENANEPLPSFKLTDLNGKTWTLADLKGKVTFLNFWATW
ncbi:MAG TPA: TlpA disulfide reductase family protein [Terriglobia bacterium]|nr:TlpA disulfide reductase family protein [Terriglobia bacterium]